jgi:UDP-2,3-diacylglucosamine hydrolase
MSEQVQVSKPNSPPLDGPIVVLGDCHLAVGHPERTRLVLRFLDSVRGTASRIIFLGDLFDFWLGAKHLDIPDFKDVLDKLRELTSGGIDISIIHGNRDFLLDSRFTARTGARLLGDCAVVQAGQLKVLLTHGDLLCTRDWRYRLWRFLVRNPLVKAIIAHLPLPLTRWLAVQMRRFSNSEISRKGLRKIGFVEAAAAEFAQDDIDALVLGHSHEAETRTIHVGGREKLVYVAGKWEETGTYLTLDRSGVRFWRFSLDGSEPADVPHRASWNLAGVPVESCQA